MEDDKIENKIMERERQKRREYQARWREKNREHLREYQKHRRLLLKIRNGN